MISALKRRLAEHSERSAVASGARSVSYAELLASSEQDRSLLTREGVEAGAIVALRADYSPRSIGLFLALADLGAVVVPISPAAAVQAADLINLAQAEWVLSVDPEEELLMMRRETSERHRHYETLRERDSPGLVLFSSGSTGAPKGIVHDLGRLLDKFEVRRAAQRTLSFLLFDHIGGFNTLFHTLSNGGLVVVPADHSIGEITAAVTQHRVELLPTSPTFLNLLLVSGALERHDFSSLRLITYGTEPMPESTLTRLAALLPAAKLQQTYGLSELGILRSSSPDRGSLWVRLGGEGYETKVQGGTLRIRARSAMLGYLNAPDPFDAEGWFDTGDLVEQDGELFRIRGRHSELINVGGQKVHPAEVESVIAELPGIAEVAVRGEPSALLGQAVMARVRLLAPETASELRGRLRKFCLERLPSYKVPVRIEISTEPLHNARFKRQR